MSTWFRTGNNYKQKDIKVDFENKIISNVSCCTEGEAKGHGVHLDSSFIKDVAKLGGEWKTGLLSRFGHPSMSSEALGTAVGRFKNFNTVDENGVLKATADIHFYKDANQKDVDELLKLAKEDPEAFGTSIVFKAGRKYKKDETCENIYEDEENYNSIDSKRYTEIESLLACDFVDEPAANNGLFSSQEMLSAKVFNFIEENQELVSLLEKDPEKMFEYIRKYKTIKEFEMGDKPKENTSDKKVLELEAKVSDLEKKLSAKDEEITAFKAKQKEELEKAYSSIITEKVAEFSVAEDKTRVETKLTAFKTYNPTVEDFRSFASEIKAPAKREVEDVELGTKKSFSTEVEAEKIMNGF